MEIMTPLIVFTTFICWSCGTFFMQGLLSFTGRGRKMQFASLATSGVLMAIGGIGVFFHLQHWERMFNGFGHITSGITQELIAVVLTAVALVLFFLMMRRTEDGIAPKWCGVMAMVVSALMVFVMAHSYMMASIPIWDTFAYVLYFLANMLTVGVLSSLVIAHAAKADDAYDLLAKLVLPLIVAYAVALAIEVAYNVAVGGSAFAQVGYYFDPTLPDVAVVDPSQVLGSVLAGENALLFWGGVVVVGIVVPAVLQVAASRRFAGAPGTYMGITAVALLSLIVGGVCWRAILYITAFSSFAFF